MSEQAVETETEDVPSVRDSILEAVKTLEPVEEAPDAEDVVEEAVGGEPETVAEPEGGEQAEASEEPLESAEEEEAEPQEVEELEPILAPASWSTEDREGWGALPREQQEVIAKREQERDTEYNNKFREIAPLRSIIDENSDYFRQIGISPTESFRGLLAAEKALRFGTPEQKAETLQRIARDYGVDMPVAQVQPEQQTDEFGFPVEPDTTQVIQTAVEQAIAPIRNDLQSRQVAEDEARQAREAEQAQATAAQFFDELGKSDRPEARYVEEVLPAFDSMVARESANGANLDAARLHEIYEAAAWATSSVRAKMLQDQADTPAPAASEATVTKRTVKKASSPSSSAGRGSPHSDDVPNDESVRDTIRRSMDELTQGTL